MEYNDCQILENYENMARAYTEALKEKGFNFTSLQEESAQPTSTNNNIVLINRIADNLNRVWRLYVEGSLSRSFVKNRFVYATLAQNMSVIIDNFKKLYPSAVFSTLLPIRVRPQDIAKTSIALLSDTIRDLCTLSSRDPANANALIAIANDLLLQIKTLTTQL